MFDPTGHAASTCNGRPKTRPHCRSATSGTEPLPYRYLRVPVAGDDRAALRRFVMAAIDIVLHRIAGYSGPVFHQKHDKSFPYSMSGDTVHLDTIDLTKHKQREGLGTASLQAPHR